MSMFKRITGRRLCLASAVALLGSPLWSPLWPSVTMAEPPDSEAFVKLITGTLPQWSMNFTNTANMEYYQHEGDRALSTHPNSGLFPYSDFDLSMTREYSDFETVRFRLGGVLNWSEYRSEEQVVVPETISLNWEKGDAGVPFRLNLGDTYAFFTPRTLQRSLKGAQLELQPVMEGHPHSFVLVMGADEDSWTRTHFQNDLYFGASWLSSWESVGTWTANIVVNTQEPSRMDNLLSTDEVVMSLAANKDFDTAFGNLDLQGEMAFVDRDSRGNGNRDDREGRSLMFEAVRTADDPVTLRLRLEDNSEFFAPRGSTATADYRSTELTGGYRFSNGLNLTGRLQNFIADQHQDNQTHTHVLGSTLTGPLGVLFDNPQINGSIDAYRQRTYTSDRLTDTKIYSLGGNVNAPLPNDWNGRFGALFQRKINEAGDYMETIQQYTVGADHAIVLFDGWNGTVSPNFLLRRTAGGPTPSWLVRPSVGTSVGKGPHSLSANAGITYQDAKATGGTDNIQPEFNVDYAYSTGPHVLRAEAGVRFNDEHPGNNVTDYHAALRWTFNYNRPAVQAANDRDAVGVLPVARPTTPSLDLITAIPPGTSLGSAVETVEGTGIRGQAAVPGAVVYEARLIPNVEQRQRLAYVHQNGSVTNSVFITDFQSVGRPQSNSDLWARVLEAFINRFGPPGETVAEGNFSNNLSADIQSGAFVRAAQWNVQGGVLRLGIPKRLDHQVRIEATLAANLPAISAGGRWSTEILR